MERLESGNSERLDFEQFKIFWLGAVFPYWRNMIFQGAVHLGEKIQAPFRQLDRGRRICLCLKRIKGCLGFRETTDQEEFFDMLLNEREGLSGCARQSMARKETDIEMMRAMGSELTINDMDSGEPEIGKSMKLDGVVRLL